MCDELFGDDLNLPLPGLKLKVWRAGGMTRFELPLEVQEAFTAGYPPLSNERNYIPLPELLKAAWQNTKEKWPEMTGFGIQAILHRLRGLPLPTDISRPEEFEVPDRVKLLIAMSETELFEEAKRNRGDEDDCSVEIIVEVPPTITLPKLLERAWQVPRNMIRQQWRMSRREITAMLNELPTPRKGDWSLFKPRPVMTELVKKLIQMTDEELRAYKRQKQREKYPPRLYGSKRVHEEQALPASNSTQPIIGPEKPAA